ncbi:transposase [Streptomyces justiciae]|uniref:Transposase n=1 Tax=Streptomyces justiciae TaxID=2780140 RepID=A0ABU3M8B2_9ACTN|nr:transposase [Streptomyces justiciae]MDT7847772.1 transposase [Streptomyces justiciae]
MVAKRKNFPEEFKRDAVALVRSSKDRTYTDIARGLGIHVETLRKWVREDHSRALGAMGGGAEAGMTSDGQEELKRLRRENARLKEDNEILRKAAAYFARETTR